MDRENAFTIEITNWKNSDFWMLISELDNESCLFDQPEFKKDGIVWFKNPPKELFQYSDCFNWFINSANLWHNDNLVTRYNYRTKVWDKEPTEENEEGAFHYDYINWEEMSNIAPKPKKSE